MSAHAHAVPLDRTTLAIGAGLTLAAAALYAFTAAPDLALVDSAELALVGATGGVPHPPGTPLYRMLAGVFAAIPGTTPARALNLMSALFAALAVGATFLAAERMLAFRAALVAPDGAARATERRLAGAVAALVFATSWNPWTWSALAEVYSLNTFLFAASWACGWAAILPGAGAGPAVAAVFFAAFGLANHHATSALMFPVLLVMALAARRDLLRSRSFATVAVAALALSASTYLTLLSAARHDRGLGWGGTTSPALLLRHITGRQYSQQVGATWDESARALREMADTLLYGAGLPAALLALAGLAVVAASLVGPGARRPGRWALAAPAVLLALNMALSARYIAGPEDRMAYDLPAAIAWSVLAALGAAAALERVPSWRILAAIVLLVVPPAVNVRRNLPLCNLRAERTARLFAEEMLGGTPPNAVVVTSEWNLYAPYLYLRHVEGWRTDLRVVDVLMLRRFWYLDYLEREYPELIAASRPEFERFRDEIRRFDLGRPYDQVNIQRWYDELLTRWVRIGQAEGGAFVDWVTPTLVQEASWVGRLPNAPDGLLVRFADPSLPPAAGARPVADRANLAYVRSRLTAASLEGDRSTLIPRHDPYWRVWSQYQAAAHSALLVAAREGDDALRRRHAEVARWFPEHEFLLRRVLPMRPPNP